MGQKDYNALQFANNSKVIIWSIDMEGFFTFCEGKALTEIGFKTAEIVGKNFFDLLKDHPLALEGIKKCLSGEEIESDHRLGEKCYMNQLAPLKDPDGKVIGVSGISTEITHRKKLESIGERIMKLPLDMICLGNLSGFFTEVNPAFETILGYTPEEITRIPFTEFIHPEDKEKTIQVLESLKGGESLVHFESRFRHKDGSFRTLEWSIDASPENDEFYAMARDITERKKYESRLQEQKNHFQTIIDTIPQQIWSATSDGEIDYLSPRFKDYASTNDLDDLLGWKWLRVLHPADVLRVESDWRFCVKHGLCFYTEYRFKNVRGEYNWLLVMSTPLLDENGRVLKYYGTCTNIQKEKTIEKNLKKIQDDLESKIKERTEKLTALVREQAILKEREYYMGMSNFLGESTRILSSSLDYHDALNKLAHYLIPRFADWGGITVVTKTGDWERVVALHKDKEKNKFLQEHLEHLPKAVVFILKEKKSIFRPNITREIIMEDINDPEIADLLLKFGLSSAMIVPIIHRDKVLGSITLNRSDDGTPFTDDELALIEELGRRVGTCIENAFLYESAQDAIESRDNFISIASHELKTPISSLKLQLQLTQKQVHPETGETVPATKLMKALDNSSEYVDKMSALVNDLLDVTKMESGRVQYNFEQVDISEVTKSVIDHYKEPMLTQGTNVSFSSEGPVMVSGDTHRLEQVIVNLLTNATKYGQQKPVEVKVQVSGDEALISVTDHGLGIPKEKFASIFERFERVDENGGISGLGLGLWISREIIKAHKGHIHVESTPGMGSTFTIHLPLSLQH